MPILLDHPTQTPPPVPDGVPHPSWCRPESCTTNPDVGDELLVVHRHVLLDEPLDAVPRGGRVVVDVVRGDIVGAYGGELLARDEAGIRVRGVAEEDELTPAAAAGLAAALSAAVALLGGAR
jgi:hypothetical protein